MDTSIGGARRDFPSTHWSLIREARDRMAPAYLQAINDLCALYWKPVYAYVRAARGYGNEEAKDLTQEFLIELVEGGLLERYAPDRGNFRSFLRGALHLFLLERHREASAQKRGGGKAIVSLAAEDLSFIDSLVGDGAEGPDAAFERQWGRSVLDHAVADLRRELVDSGKEKYFLLFDRHELNPAAGGSPTHAELALEFGIAESDVNNYLVYCRKLLRDRVLGRIREYVEGEGEVDEELRRLFR